MSDEGHTERLEAALDGKYRKLRACPPAPRNTALCGLDQTTGRG